ncbi:MAG: dTDP-4-dehydrorhamnose 3,5-epimerase family protein [Candidatus Brennerbacteria bacterium]
MKILYVKNLPLPDVKLIGFSRFRDERGYFTEHFRKSDLFNHHDLPGMKGINFVQANQSYSKKGVVRGLHFQWNPFMGKLVRTISGHMLDLLLDIRKGSDTFGKAMTYDLPASQESDLDEWIWVPPGFAHGNYFKLDTVIEYFCSGEYSQGCEAGISPLASDIDWSLCDNDTLRSLRGDLKNSIITEKDRNGLSLKTWVEDERSNNFIYDDMKKLGLF